MTFAVIVEGKTERAFREKLVDFLRTHTEEGKQPGLRFIPQEGRLPTDAKLRGLVARLLEKYDRVIALTDVYTGNPKLYADADDAKQKMREWMGDEPRFFAHAAQHDFEAWLLPYWDTIQTLTGSNRKTPGLNPEKINHNRPPAAHIKDAFRIGTKGRHYNKAVDGMAILKNNDLMVAVQACPELKAFINTIFQESGNATIV